MNDPETPTTTLAVGVTIAILGVITVGLRFYIRHQKRAGFKWDDWLILASLLLTLTTDILVVHSNSGSLAGKEAAAEPSLDGSSPSDVISNKFNFAATVLYFSVTCTTKLSILLLYNRLFSVSDTFRRRLIILCVVVSLYWVGSTLADVLNCIPLYHFWINDLDDPKYCFDFNIFWFVTGIVEVVIDVFILLLPIGVVTKLQLSVKRKFAVGSVFAFGTFVIVSGLLKTVYGYNPHGRMPLSANTQLWTTIHGGTGIICACLPVCWPALARLWPFGEWTWARSGISSERGQRWSSRSGPPRGSAREASETTHETYLDASSRERMIPLDRAATNKPDANLSSQPNGPLRPPKIGLDYL
ncbi:hypothetical protein F4777DRAFT_531835 [Nemania sp. FL0916]|nr:hypothetical protein F4777DRAFT_531835 [Nemania sp. FL0916]